MPLRGANDHIKRLAEQLARRIASAAIHAEYKTRASGFDVAAADGIGRSTPRTSEKHRCGRVDLDRDCVGALVGAMGQDGDRSRARIDLSFAGIDPIGGRAHGVRGRLHPSGTSSDLSGAYFDRSGACAGGEEVELHGFGARFDRDGAAAYRFGADVEGDGARFHRDSARGCGYGAEVVRNGACFERSGACFDRSGARFDRNGARVRRFGAHFEAIGASA